VLLRAVSIVSALAFAVFLGASLWLGRLERSGPAHTELTLEGGVPATFYIPVEGGDARRAFLDPPARDARPPGVVLMHGFASDRRYSSSMARRLAQAGYAVLAIDARGHGQNREPFLRSFGRPEFFQPDLAAAVDFLRVSPFCDGSRLAVMGHSMGAGAVLDYATRDSGIDAAVMIAGGWTALGPYRPPNALFIFSEGDPEQIKGRSLDLAAQLAGVEAVELERVYGDFARGSAVRAYEVAGTDHARIVWDDVALREIIAWLDAVFDVARPAAPETSDPRLRAVGVLFAAMFLVLPGLGVVVGRLVPRAGAFGESGRARGLAALAVALAATLPLLAVGNPGAILSLESADVIVSHLFLAGVALLVMLVLMRAELAPVFRGWPRSLAGATVGLIGAYWLMAPVAAVLHGMAPTPERLLLFGVAALAVFPMTLSFQVLLRRGPPPSASAFAVAGRVLILLALVAGVWLGILGGVVILMLPGLAILFVQAELLATPIYAVSRNLAAIAFLDATWLAFVMASQMPIRV
jgi:dienelactone hydrolase